MKVIVLVIVLLFTIDSFSKEKGFITVGEILKKTRYCQSLLTIYVENKTYAKNYNVVSFKTRVKADIEYEGFIKDLLDKYITHGSFYTSRWCESEIKTLYNSLK